MIKLINVKKTYSDFVAVDIEKLEIPKGVLFGFLGPNGAGKTTTIKMLTGLMLPSEGQISINGYDLVKQPEKAKSLFGYVADKPNIYSKLTGREFVGFMANLYGISTTRHLESEIEATLEKFDLTEHGDKLIQNYSHGMKQKIAIAGALIHNPELLILDEPTVGLDPQGAKALKDILVSYVKSGKTIFMSTHILEIAEKICDLVCIINKGKILFVGSVEQLQEIKGNKSLEDIFVELISKEND